MHRADRHVSQGIDYSQSIGRNRRVVLRSPLSATGQHVQYYYKAEEQRRVINKTGEAAEGQFFTSPPRLAASKVLTSGKQQKLPYWKFSGSSHNVLRVLVSILSCFKRSGD